MGKHTEKPWSFNQAKGKVLACVAMAGKLLVFKNKVSDADGQLIAAAPELLEALEGYISAVDMMNAAMKDGINVHGAMSGLIGAEDNARAAIARARGEV